MCYLVLLGVFSGDAAELNAYHIGNRKIIQRHVRNNKAELVLASGLNNLGFSRQQISVLVGVRIAFGILAEYVNRKVSIRIGNALRIDNRQNKFRTVSVLDRLINA